MVVNEANEAPSNDICLWKLIVTIELLGMKFYSCLLPMQSLDDKQIYVEKKLIPWNWFLGKRDFMEKSLSGN